jgi:hypothetical protein
MAVGRPPIYDRSVQRVSEAKSKTEVMCKANGGEAGSLIRYTMKYMNASWLIDSMHSSYDDVKWSKRGGF